jgi:Bacterial DNA-binding protein.
MKYYLSESKLTDERKYTARVSAERSYDLPQLIDLMLSKRNLVSKTDIVAVFTAFFETIDECIERGENINLPIFNMGYSITGVFDKSTDTFNPEEHEVHVNLNIGTQIKKAIENIKLEKINSVQTLPVIEEFTDLSSNTVNSKLTANGIFEITGRRLKIAGEDETVGIFFVNGDNTEHKVSVIAENGYKKVIAQAPALSAGTYKLVIRTQSTSSTYTTKEIKEVVGKFALTVD